MYLGIVVLLGHNFIELIAGLIFAHTYFYLRTTVAQKTGFDVLKAPGLMRRMVKIYTDWAARENPFAHHDEDEE